ncbi:MAG: hypothetical protein JJE08_09900, partial [Proteiniphilum sp.]|nr:hypothetical protein [Proteiniphilum sp.]
MMSTTVTMKTIARTAATRINRMFTTSTRRISALVAALIFVLCLTPMRAEKINRFHQTNIFSMEMMEDSTLTEGMAGSFFGKQGNHFIMAGGSAFPFGKPWEGGKKHFSDQVFLFLQNSKGNLEIIYSGNDLPRPLAEGASATLPQGLLCMG